MHALLCVSQGPQVSPCNHRDDFAGKQAITPGFRLGIKLSQLVKTMCTKANNSVTKALDQGNNPNMLDILRKLNFTAKINRAMTSGNFTASPTRQAQTGKDATELLNTHNRVVMLRDVGKGRKETPKTNKTVEPRLFDPSQAGYTCPMNTTDSDTTGLIHQRPWGATYCDGVATDALYRSCVFFCPEFRCGRVIPVGGVRLDEDGEVCGGFVDEGWADASTHDRRVLRALARAARYQARCAQKWGVPDPDPKAALHWIFANGNPIGIAERPLDLARQLRELRVGHMLHRHASVAVEPSRRAVHIMGEPGGFRRLLMRTGALGFEECTRLAQSILRDRSLPDRQRLTALLDAGVCEYVCPLEERNVNVRPMAYQTPAEQEIRFPPPYSHCELHPLAHVSDVIAAIAAFQMAQGTRATFSSNIYRSMVDLLRESYAPTSAMGQLVTSRRVVSTFGLRELGLDAIGSGVNVPHATMAMGRNQEDSLVISRQAVQLGFGAIVVRTTYTKTATSYRRSGGGGGGGGGGGLQRHQLIENANRGDADLEAVQSGLAATKS